MKKVSSTQTSSLTLVMDNSKALNEDSSEIEDTYHIEDSKEESVCSDNTPDY
jgi:hypothetical protein